MGGWTLAQGRHSEQTLAEVTAAGATRIALANANSIFSPGQLLFVSEADGSETEFLGGVTQSDATGLNFALALQKSKNSGARVWRPATSFMTGAEEATPSSRRVRTGVTLERSLGGVSYAIRTAQPSTILDWSLEGLTPVRERDLISWIETATENGLLSFNIISPARAIASVRLEHEDYSRVVKEGGRCSVKLALLIEAEGQYR